MKPNLADPSASASAGHKSKKRVWMSGKAISNLATLLSAYNQSGNSDFQPRLQQWFPHIFFIYPQYILEIFLI
jgi:hypothetical protein